MRLLTIWTSSKNKALYQVQTKQFSKTDIVYYSNFNEFKARLVAELA